MYGVRLFSGVMLIDPVGLQPVIVSLRKRRQRITALEVDGVSDDRFASKRSKQFVKAHSLAAARRNDDGA